jgi:hypothetical protein
MLSVLSVLSHWFQCFPCCFSALGAFTQFQCFQCFRCFQCFHFGFSAFTRIFLIFFLTSINTVASNHTKQAMSHPEIKKAYCATYPDLPIWTTDKGVNLIGAVYSVTMLYPDSKKSCIQVKFSRYHTKHGCMKPEEFVADALENGTLEDGCCYKLSNGNGHPTAVLTLKGAQYICDHKNADMDAVQHKKFCELVRVWRSNEMEVCDNPHRKRTRNGPSNVLQPIAISQKVAASEVPDMAVAYAKPVTAIPSDEISIVDTFMKTVQQVHEYHERERLDVAKERLEVAKERQEMAEERTRKDKLIESMVHRLLER